MEVWGLTLVKGFYIKYNFILADNVKYSSYTYQKLFRAIYGYTQNVTKANGKTYRYHRKGVLSDVPYIKTGKNSVIIPPKALNSLDNFFKTGKNPAHYWQAKGNWKATFYMDEKELGESQVVAAIKSHISRAFQTMSGDVFVPDITVLAGKAKAGEVVPEEHIKISLEEAEKIISNPWFKDVYSKDPDLKKFFENYKFFKP